jgi:AraC family transcriptional activator of pyochelin receptor
MLRTARSMELLCQLFAALEADRMVEVGGATTLSEQDIVRVAAAHQLVNECWQEKLTVSTVARRCGLSKAKLTYGFRQLYQCTVPEAVSARRLEHARQLLAQSDLQISSIGYRCGYLSNASFTRAFARRFGMAPTEMRRLEMTP